MRFRILRRVETMNTINPLLQSALAFAALGLRVLPLHSVRDGTCSCSKTKCRSSGRHPRTFKGVKDASTDPKQIEKWWKKFPDANVGIATGDGLRVLDVDPRNGGDVTLAQMEAVHGPLPKTVTVESGGGGRHCYFRVPAGAPNRCGIGGLGLDIKGEGGYVVAPPSLHASGARYRHIESFTSTELAEWPAWLVGHGDCDGAGRDSAAGSDQVEVTTEIAELITNGKPMGERSEAVHKVLKALLSAGTDERIIVAVMMDPKNGISAKPREKKIKWLKGEIIRARHKLNTGFGSNARGFIEPNSQHNIDEALRRLGVKLSYDMFADQYLMDGLEGAVPLLSDAGLNRLWLTIDEKFHFRPTLKFFQTVIEDRARGNGFHPVRDYLDGLKWDGVSRIDAWLTTYAGAKDTPYTRAVGRLPLIAAVRRARKPGTKFDEMLVLCSAEGKDKSTALAVLAVKEEWFCDDVSLNIRGKEMIEQLQGVWIVECADLKGFAKNENEAVKALLSRRIDKARKAYDRLPSTVARSCVFFGTTNDTAFLRGTTGNRRFWPVEIEKFDLEALRRDRDQLWAEAAVREAKGESIRLDPQLYDAAREEQEARRVEDPLLHTLQLELGDKVGKIRAVDVWVLLNITPAQRAQVHNVRVGETMKELGWKRGKWRFGGKDARVGLCARHKRRARAAAELLS